MASLTLELGVKSDPILYRYSYEWLFRLMAEEQVKHVQIGTFFELYQLPDEFFRELRKKAADQGVLISSVFTAHRELGGFFRDDAPGFVEVARKNFERLVHAAGLMGAKAIGSNPGAVLRDRMGTKSAGTKTYLRHFKALMHVAHDVGIEWLTIEPMSCLAEPPTLPDEMREMAEELNAYHSAHNGSTARPGYCVDIAHGYADAEKRIMFDNMQLYAAALPNTNEIHLKNTDKLFNSTFGFSAAERAKGIVNVEAVRDFTLQHSNVIPVKTLIGYLEIGGPKLGRDYSDGTLEGALRESLRHLKQTWECHRGSEVQTFQGSEVACGSNGAEGELPGQANPEIKISHNGRASRRVLVAPSMMCADLLHLEANVRQLEAAGVDLLHFDLMDAHFAPNMPLGLATLEQLRPKTDRPFDVHLMVENNELFIRELAKIGAQQISVHVESATHLDRTLHLIREQGIKAGVALNPATPLSALDYVHEAIDYVLVMTVNPGFAGQKLVASAIRKIADCRAYLQSRGLEVGIQVDGNVSFENIPKMVAAGADMLVAGTSSIFHRGASLKDNAAKLQAAIKAGLEMREAAVNGAVARVK